MTWIPMAIALLPLLMLQAGPPAIEDTNTAREDNVELMDAKTRHAQNIFRHLAEAKLEKVSSEAAALERITLKTGFDQESETYEEYGQHFLRIVRALKAEAEQGSLAGSYYEFSRMTGVCFACHDHLRDGDE